MKLPDTAHTSRPWRIHEIAHDFTLEDVWALPTPGGPDDFPRLVHNFAVGDTSDNPSRLARTLFAIRWKLGELLGWDDPDSAVGSRVPTLRDRLPADLRDAPPRARPALIRRRDCSNERPLTPVYISGWCLRETPLCVIDWCLNTGVRCKTVAISVREG